MAKTIMISNDIYEELKSIKGEKSFSEVIRVLVNKGNLKKGAGLKDCIGILKKDREWNKVERGLERGWKGWNKKYV